MKVPALTISNFLLMEMSRSPIERFSSPSSSSKEILTKPSGIKGSENSCFRTSPNFFNSCYGAILVFYNPFVIFSDTKNYKATLYK